MEVVFDNESVYEVIVDVDHNQFITLNAMVNTAEGGNDRWEEIDAEAFDELENVVCVVDHGIVQKE